MRIFEFITEASPLDLGKVTKREGRVDKFLDLIDKGHTFNSKSGPVELDKKQIPYLKSVLKPENVGKLRIKVTTTDGKSIPMGDVHFDEKAWGEFGKGGDSDVKFKPAEVLPHEEPEKGQPITAELALKLGGFPANQLAEKIKNSPKLKEQGKIGQAVIDMVDEIEQGQLPTVPDIPKKVLSSVVNDAFEYLGILALINGIADFPNSEEFYDHIGSSINDMILYFPKAANNPLTDSYALQNQASKNTINISSKGRKGGAASSINTLKIPEDVQKKNNDTIKFLDYIKSPGIAWQQPFLAANFIHGSKTGKGKLGDLEQFLPFTSETMIYIKSIWDNRRKGVPKKLEDIPEQFRPLFELVWNWSKNSDHALGYNIRNYVKDVIVLDAINNKNAIPSWNPTMLEVLGMNFVVLKTEIKSGKFVTKVNWPSKMDGKIVLAAKDGADKWESNMTWKLS